MKKQWRAPSLTKINTKYLTQAGGTSTNKENPNTPPAGDLKPNDPDLKKRPLVAS